MLATKHKHSFGYAGGSPELYCQRCPTLESATDYTLLLVARSDAHRHRSSALQLLPVTTRDVTPPIHLINPSVSNIGEVNFSLTVTLDEPGEHKGLPSPLQRLFGGLLSCCVLPAEQACSM